MPVRNRFAELLPQIAAWRHDLHAHPELGYEVHRTAGIVAEKLRAFGCDEVVTGIGRTGVVGLIRGRGAGPTLGLRADMDALPITEATGAPYASQTPGVMHACGHDGHTAMLLGAAQYLAETRNFAGCVAVIFQPAEEGGAGGEAMVKDGLMDRFGIAEVYGMHTAPGLPLGMVATRPGPLMASSDEFDLTVQGQGGHAAEPHAARDPVPAACATVTALQTVASRETDPLKQVVVTVTTIRTQTDSYNVIPESVHLKGTVRTLDDGVRAHARDAFHRIARATAEAHGCTARIDWHPGYPVTVNAPDHAAFAAEAATAVAPRVEPAAPPIMASEDFSYMLAERPGAYLFLGNGDGPMVHTPQFDFDDEAIPVGCSLFVEIVERRLPL